MQLLIAPIYLLVVYDTDGNMPSVSLDPFELCYACRQFIEVFLMQKCSPTIELDPSILLGLLIGAPVTLGLLCPSR